MHRTDLNFVENINNTWFPRNIISPDLYLYISTSDFTVAAAVMVLSAGFQTLLQNLRFMNSVNAGTECGKLVQFTRFI